MKTKPLLVVMCILLVHTANAQFPAPTDFQFSYDYFMIGDGGYCDGTFLIGPTYCSHFSWNTPDTSSTNATLTYYKVHYTSDTTICFPYFDTAYIATGNTLSVQLGVIGWVWVTAVYSDPDGESEASNVAYNFTLPIGIPEKDPVYKSPICFDQVSKKLSAVNPSEIVHFRIFNAIGNCINEIHNVGTEYYLNELTGGMYIIEAELKNHTKVHKKIIID